MCHGKETTVGGVWKESHDFTTSIPPRCSHTSTMIGRCMFVVGGGVVHPALNRFVHSSEIWKIDFAAKTQTLLSIEGFEGRRGHSAISFRDRYILIFGGYKTAGDHDILSDDLIIIDTIAKALVPFLDKTSQMLNEAYMKPSARRGHMAALCTGKSGSIPYMLVMGGDHDGDLLDWDHHFVYIFSLVTFNPGYTSDEDKGGGVAMTVQEETVAQVDLGVGEGMLWEGHWKRCEIQGKLPMKLALAAFVQSGSELLIFGGSYFSIQQQSLIVSNQINANLYVLDVNTFELTNISGHVSYTVDAISCNRSAGASTATALIPRFCAAMAVVADTFLVIFGGTTQQGDNLSDLLVLHSGRSSSHTDVSSERLSWRQRQLRCVNGSSCHPPSPRNGMSLVAYEAGGCWESPSLVMFGGGRFPDVYHGDIWYLNLLSSPVGAVCQQREMLQQEKSSFDSYFESCFESKRHADVVLVPQANGSGGSSSSNNDSSSNSGRGLKSIGELQQGTPPPPPSILAHKIILAAKSSFFCSLFDGQWAENMNSDSSGSSSSFDSGGGDSINAGRSTMQHICVEAKLTPLCHVLQYMYTASMDLQQAFATLQGAVDVLQCAAMLGVPACKAVCERELARKFLKLGQHVGGSSAGVSVDRGVMRLAYTADELVSLEQEAMYILSIADTYHCEHLCRAALEQVRVCHHVLSPTVTLGHVTSATNVASDARTDKCKYIRDTVDDRNQYLHAEYVDMSSTQPHPFNYFNNDHDEDCSAVLYSEFLASLTPEVSTRLEQALDPASVLFSSPRSGCDL